MLYLLRHTAVLPKAQMVGFLPQGSSLGAVDTQPDSSDSHVPILESLSLISGCGFCLSPVQSLGGGYGSSSWIPATHVGDLD